ncbi:MAG: DUF1566 domain-containing protein [Deltaproteobacteria bacterium]|nr:DUF1566 domain-containing protein [Deltaproteobacteria bacterium]MBW2140291.1 DUF1566 domain-containing protein [Deltaproteobacteria bacterium]MBW2322134.1 DUF1566 domain-containing protein [Deltaproteobacteria bacterium]
MLMRRRFFSCTLLKVFCLVLIAMMLGAVNGCVLKPPPPPDPSRFVPQGDWAILDTKTGLYWEVKTWNNHTQTMTWAEAKAYCKNLKLGGYQDWRLPKPKELKTLFDLNFVPTIRPGLFKYPQTWCWSANWDVLSSEAFYADFTSGKIRNAHRKTSFSVRAVRK